MECLDFKKKLMSKMSGKKMGEEFCFQQTIFFKPDRSFEWCKEKNKFDLKSGLHTKLKI